MTLVDVVLTVVSLSLLGQLGLVHVVLALTHLPVSPRSPTNTPRRRWHETGSNWFSSERARAGKGCGGRGLWWAGCFTVGGGGNVHESGDGKNRFKTDFSFFSFFLSWVEEEVKC